jgi:hypothetical protein
LDDLVKLPPVEARIEHAPAAGPDRELKSQQPGDDQDQTTIVDLFRPVAM